jgi:hypothetical protein
MNFMKTALMDKSGYSLQSLIIACLMMIPFTGLAQATDDYRTRAGVSASWFGTSTWQRFNGTSWVDVATTPTSANQAIEIRSDAAVTIPAALTVDQLTVNGILTYNNANNGAGQSFTLNNGTGTDMIINGTFIFNGTGNQANFGINTGATWSVSSGGTYVHNSARGVTTPLGAVSLNSASNFIYRGSSTLNPAVSISSRTYGNLIFESTSGALSITPSGSGALIVQGDFSVGGTGAGTTTLNMGSFTGTLGVTGTSTVVAGSTLTTPNAVYTATGDMTVNGTLTFSNNITAGGNWVQGSAGTQNNSTRTVTFNSASTQTITKTGGGTVTFNNVTVNKSGGTLILGSSTNVTASGTLALTAGNAVIGSNTLTAATITGTSGSLEGSNTSNLTITGTGSSLFFDNSGTNNFLRELTLNTGAAATLGNALNITAYDGVSTEGVLTVTGTATLTTGGFLTLKSNANGTARIAAGRTTGGYISGNVTVERFIPQNSSKAWRLLASTSSGQTINAAWQEGQNNAMNNPNPGFGTKISAGAAITTNLGTAQAAGFDTLSAGVSLFRYNAATDALVPVTATNTGNIANEHGYFLFIRGDRAPGQFGAGAPSSSTVLRSTGSLFLGDQTAVATGASNYGLVRNPYPSRIDMRSIVRGSNLIDAYQVWDAKLGGTFGVGGFQTFSKSGSDYIVSPGGGSYGANGSVHNFIESGAAFFIQSTTNTNNTAQVTEACKTSASNTNSFRPSGVLAADKRVTFTLYALNPGSTDVVDGGLVFFNDTYSNSVTVEDVRKSGNFNENFGITRDNVDLVVERRKNVTASDSVFFKMYQLRQISYRLDFESLNFDPAFTTVILQDKFTNTNTAIDLTALTSYTFTVSSTAGSFAQDRFRLVLAASSNTFSGSGNWTDNARWSHGAPPAEGETVIVAAGANATLDTDFTVAGNLTMMATSSLEVLPARTLTISGTADFAGQSVTFRSDETGNGSLGQVSGTLNGATNVTVERYIPNNGFRSWRLLSVPTYGNVQTIRQAWQEGNANPLPLQNNLPNRGTQITGVFASQAAAAAAGFDSTSAQASLLRWNGTGWSNITNTNTAIANEKAYFLFIRGERSKGVTGSVNNSSATTLRTNGTVYTGNQVFNVPTGGFAVAANLYPSAVDFTSLTRNNVSNLFYIWDSKKQNGNSLGVYQTFSATNSFNCLIGGGSYTLGQPNTVIESGQAFFVRGGAVAGGGTITLTETAKTGSANGNLGFRPSDLPAKIDSRLLDANNEVLDVNVVVFDKAYSKAIDADDAEKFGNPGANFAIETNSKLLAIEGTQPVTENDIIQFRIWNLQQQEYKLEFSASRMKLEGLYAVLEDSYLKERKEIDVKNSSTISFSVNSDPASSAANRFRIVFTKTRPALQGTDGFTVAPNPVVNNRINLAFTNQEAGKYTIRLTGIDGKVITTLVVNHEGGSSNRLIMLPSNTRSGAYQLEINAPTGSKIVKQLFVSGLK